MKLFIQYPAVISISHSAKREKPSGLLRATWFISASGRNFLSGAASLYIGPSLLYDLRLMTVTGGKRRGNSRAGFRDSCLYRIRNLLSAENIPQYPLDPAGLRLAVRHAFLPALAKRPGGRHHRRRAERRMRRPGRRAAAKARASVSSPTHSSMPRPGKTSSSRSASCITLRRKPVHSSFPVSPGRNSGPFFVLRPACPGTDPVANPLSGMVYCLQQKKNRIPSLNRRKESFHEML